MTTGIIILTEIKKREPGFPPDIHCCNNLFNSFFFDPGTFTAAASQEVEFCLAHFTYFVEGNRLNMRG